MKNLRFCYKCNLTNVSRYFLIEAEMSHWKGGMIEAKMKSLKYEENYLGPTFE